MRPGIFWALESPKMGELFTIGTGVELFTDEVSAGRRGAVVQQALAQAVKDGAAPVAVDVRDWRPVKVFVVQYPSFLYRSAAKVERSVGLPTKVESDREMTARFMGWPLVAVDAYNEYLDRVPEFRVLPEADLLEAIRVDWLVGV